MSEINVYVGAQIRKYRKACKLTMQELADAIHKSRATVCKYENGTRRISDEKLVQLSAYFNVSIDVILGTAYKVDPTSPQFQKDAKTRSFLNAIVTILTPDERSLLHELLSNFSRLNESGKSKLVEESDTMVRSRKFENFGARSQFSGAKEIA